MSQVIGLLMLALSLLQAVRDNPSLPQSFKDTATSVALQAIAEANNQIALQNQPATITPMPEGSAGQPQAQVATGTDAPTPSTFEVYDLKLETADNYYYAGEKELASASVNGTDAAITTSQYFPDDCINIWKGGTIQKKVCGYWMARFSRTDQALQLFHLVAKDGSTYDGGIVENQ